MPTEITAQVMMMIEILKIEGNTIFQIKNSNTKGGSRRIEGKETNKNVHKN